MIREFILQMKRDASSALLPGQFGIDVLSRFAEQFGALQERGFLRVDDDSLSLSREGCCRWTGCWHEFFLPQHRNARAT